MSSKEKYINPFTDFGFKKLFKNEYNKDLLIDFLNQVLGDREQIKDLTYLNTEKLGTTEHVNAKVATVGDKLTEKPYLTCTVKMRKATNLSSNCRMYRSSISKTAVSFTLPFPYKSRPRKAISRITT